MIVLALVLSVLFLVETPVQAEDEKTTRFVNLGEDQVEFNDSFTKDLNGRPFFRRLVFCGCAVRSRRLYI